ncbi:MAG: hypothetical protein LBP58_10690 [Azoarcus sp.]|nr:hypothetical protein [Azoarcus sp.]
MLQLELARAAYAAQRQTRNGLRYLRRFTGRKPPKGIEADYFDKIQAVLENVDLKPRTLSSIDARVRAQKDMTEWLEAQREVGLEPEIDPRWTSGVQTNYRNLTHEELRGLVDSVMQIEHLGRLKNRLLTAEKNRNFATAVEEIVKSIHENAKHVETGPIYSKEGDAIARTVQNWYGSHKRGYTLAAMLDGRLSGGPVWEYLIRTANAAGDRETLLNAEYTAKLMAIIKPLGRFDTKRTWSETLKRDFTGAERFALALNVGNAGNLQRLQDGNGWSPEAIKAELRKLPAAQLHAAQQIWDLMETLRPMLAEQERRLYGHEPEWVEPQPITLVSVEGETVTLRGGYFPLKYDPDASGRTGDLDAAAEAKRQLLGAYGSAGTRPGSMKTRVDRLAGRPVLITNTTLYTSIEDTIHYLAWQDWMIDANRLLRNEKIQEAVRRTQGPQTLKQIKAFVRGNGEGNRRLNDGAMSWVLAVRRNVSAAGLAFNLVSAAVQPLGLIQSGVAIGPRYLAKGMGAFLSGAPRMARDVNELSPFMAKRARTMLRELNEVRNTIAGQGVRRQWLERNGYVLMSAAQKLVDYPTWWGAYQQALDGGNDSAKAVAMADQAVIASQGSGMVKDLSAMERHPIGKIFTVFYNFMGTNLNLGMISAETARTRGEAAALLFVLFVVSPMIEMAFRAALTLGDDDDDETLWKKLAANEASFLLGSFVGLRELQNISQTIHHGRANYEGPTGLRAISDAYKWSDQAAQGEFDRAFLRTSINLIGSATGLPAAQINRTASGIDALAEDETDNPLAVLLGYRRAR